MAQTRTTSETATADDSNTPTPILIADDMSKKTRALLRDSYSTREILCMARRSSSNSLRVEGISEFMGEDRESPFSFFIFQTSLLKSTRGREIGRASCRERVEMSGFAA